jgi:tRNA1Val (adenine37-N6)-methyltransferase
MNPCFRFKKFDIYHDKCAMKVGTDGVLLGAWCNADGARRVLDIGAGSGLISLMLAQRNPACMIEGIEIDRESYEQAAWNVSRSPWQNRIKITLTSFQEYVDQTDKSFDLIVANPPYFQNSLTGNDSRRTAARHACTLTMDDLVNGIGALLDHSGRYCMIMPVNEGNIFIRTAREKGLHCRQITRVIPNPGKPPKRLLLEFSPRNGNTKITELTIELGKRHEYSPEFRSLTGDFYLSSGSLKNK